MDIPAIVRGAVSLADNVVKSAEATTIHNAWTSKALDGKPTFNGGGAGTSRLAIVEYGQGRRWSAILGQTVDYSTKITILGPVAANGASGRNEPIDSRDTFTTPDGATRPIRDIKGITDPSTQKPYMYEVYLA